MQSFVSWLESNDTPVCLGVSHFLYKAHVRILLGGKIYTYHTREWAGTNKILQDLQNRNPKYQWKVWKAFNNLKKEAGDDFEVEEA